MNNFTEINFDGLIGSTHNYAGLALGNLASDAHKNQTSNPRAAALQGLKKMIAVRDLGLIQGFTPPLERPNITILRKLGFEGNVLSIIEQTYRYDPALLASVFSASSMWTANCGVFIPKQDSTDNNYHIIPANLASHFHRGIEASSTASHLKHIFAGENFIHHEALPNLPGLNDEGAANHTRLCPNISDNAFHLFIYGDKGEKFSGRQNLMASQSVARLGKVKTGQTIFAKQSRQAIDAGAFHNDVVAVGNEKLLFCHEYAWHDQKALCASLQKQMPWLEIITVSNKDVSLQDAVSSYLFNSQIINPNEKGEYGLILPMECQENPKINDYIKRLVDADNLLSFAKFFDLKQSMANGGGPACLRFRAQIAKDDLRQINQSFILTDDKINNLHEFINSSYRDRLCLDDLRDPLFIDECFQTLDNLSSILGISNLYEFQRD